MKTSSILIVISLAGIVGATRMADFMQNGNTAAAVAFVAVFGVLYGVVLKLFTRE